MIKLTEEEMINLSVATVYRDSLRGKLTRENIRLRQRNGLNMQLVDPHRLHRVTTDLEDGGWDV